MLSDNNHRHSVQARDKSARISGFSYFAGFSLLHLMKQSKIDTDMHGISRRGDPRGKGPAGDGGKLLEN